MDLSQALISSLHLKKTNLWLRNLKDIWVQILPAPWTLLILWYMFRSVRAFLLWSRGKKLKKTKIPSSLSLLCVMESLRLKRTLKFIESNSWLMPGPPLNCVPKPCHSYLGSSCGCLQFSHLWQVLVSASAFIGIVF